jgi:uncharacterized delta-60 repeat protein
LYAAAMRIPLAATGNARALFVLAAALFLCLQPKIASTSPGDLDPTFGAGGKVTTDFRGFYDNAFAAALQSDGKIVAAGESYRDTTFTDLALARYNTDGTLDTSFGSGAPRNTADGSRGMVKVQPTQRTSAPSGIPPTGIGGWLKSSLHSGLQRPPEYRRRESGDG